MGDSTKHSCYDYQFPDNGDDRYNLTPSGEIFSNSLDVLNGDPVLCSYSSISDPASLLPNNETTTVTVSSLLKQWDVQELEEHFQKNQVDLKSLKYARREQLKEILQNISWGVRVKFEHELFAWQRSLGTFVEDAPCNPIHYTLLNMDKNEASVNPSLPTETEPISSVYPALPTQPVTLPAEEGLNLSSTKAAHQQEDTIVNLNIEAPSQEIAADAEQAQSSSNLEPLPGTSTDVTADVTLIDLREILKNYTEGKALLKLSDEKKREIPETHKQMLVDKIVDYYIQRNLKLNINSSAVISQQIKKLFPDEVVEYYFAPQKGKAPKGKLLAKFYNQSRKLKSCGLVEGKVVKRTRHSKTPEPLPDSEEGAINIKEKLKYIQEGDRWDEVKNLWKACQQFRRNMLIENKSETVAEIINEWPAYKHPMGYSLVELDFKKLFPEADTKFFTAWLPFSENVLHVLKNKVKDKKSKKVLESITDEQTSEDGKHAVILYTIHAAIIPTSKRYIKCGNKKTLQKFTITDSQDSFMLIGNTVAEIEQKLIQKKSAQMPVQPLLVIIFEDTISNPKEFLVYFDNIKYKFFSVVSALNCCFQLFHVFNLKYPIESQAVWQFIQVYLYGITTTFDIVSPNITMFINDLKKMVGPSPSS